MRNRIALATLALFALVAVAAQSAGAGSSPAPSPEANADERNKLLVRRYYEEAWNKMKLEAIDEIFVPPFESERMKDVVSTIHFGIPDIHFSIDQIFAGEGNRVVVVFTASGTHSAELFGTPASGKRISFSSMEIFRFKDGKIYEKQNADSSLLLMQQIGALCRQAAPK